MQDVVNIPWYVYKLCYVVIVEGELLTGEQMLNIAQVARQQIVHANDFIAFSKEAVAKMGAKKARSTGNKDAFQNCEW